MWKGVYIALVLICIALSIVGIVLMYMRYAECNSNILFISITLVSMIVLIALSVVKWVNVGLLPSTVVSLYLVALCYQAVRANPCAACFSLPLSTYEKDQNQPGMIMNSLIAAFTITWTSWRTSATNTAFFGSSSVYKQSDNILDEDDELASIGLVSARIAEDDHLEVEIVPQYQFHVLIILASLYMAMVLTDWGSVDG
ncbi:unnamed protein product [Peronospora belbahrii]|uniref:Uncharacterized protein n=1 Tax=Peronospora belbahrii TaxID=622444 RepID=A0AAU9LGN4_9STRA|nr:unnamed protein product [Peronospora belbahrii]CAH0522454.1 unnamed protein product [Peronospora belbahrii]